LGFTNHAFGQTPLDGSPQLKNIFQCQSIKEANKRLECYDTSVADFQSASRSGEIVTISKQQIEEVERDSFGFNIPSIPKIGELFGINKKEEASGKKEDTLTSPVKKAASGIVNEKDIKKEPIFEKTPIESIKIGVRRTQTFGYQKIRFFLDNGQVWEQIDTVKIRVPKSGKSNKNVAYIEKAALGSFELRLNNKGAAVKVRRVR